MRGALPPPTIRSVTTHGEPTKVVVQFAQPPDAASAAKVAHYQIDQGVEIVAVTADSNNPRTVVLTTSPLKDGVTYVLTVRGVRPALRPMQPKAAFQYLARRRVTDGLVVLYTFDEGEGEVIHDVSGIGEPLDLAVKHHDRVQWVAGGAVFAMPTVAQSSGSASKVFAACRKTNAVTLEAWLKPANLTQGGPARIVSVSKNPNERLFTLGQHQADVHVRLRTTVTGPNGDTPLVTSPGAVGPPLAHVVYTRDAAGVARVYLNGRQHTTAAILGDFSTWEDTMPLCLGNEPTYDRPWLGELHLVALYARALTPDEVAQNQRAGPDPPKQPK